MPGIVVLARTWQIAASWGISDVFAHRIIHTYNGEAPTGVDFDEPLVF
jgi:hypothetical protein